MACENLNNSTLGETIACVQSSIISAISSRSETLIGEGQDLAGVLLLITVSVTVLMWILSGDGAEALTESIGHLMRYFVVVVLLTGWVGVVGSFFGGSVNSISARLSGVNSVQTAVDTIAKAAVRLFVAEESDERQCREESGVEPSTGIPYTNTVCDPPPGGKAEPVSGWDVLVSLPKFLMALALKVVAAMMLALMLIAYVIAIVMAEMSFGIGMALGPILVPWMIWQRTEWLFDGWLRFMVSAAMTKIVAALMVATVAGVVNAARALANMVDGPSALSRIDLLSAWMLAVVAAIGAYMMWQVQSLASALVSGGSGPNSKSFGSGTVGRRLKGMVGIK